MRTTVLTIALLPLVTIYATESKAFSVDISSPTVSRQRLVSEERRWKNVVTFKDTTQGIEDGKEFSHSEPSQINCAAKTYRSGEYNKKGEVYWSDWQGLKGSSGSIIDIYNYVCNTDFPNKQPPKQTTVDPTPPKFWEPGDPV